MLKERRTARPTVDEAAFSINEMGKAAYLATKPGHRMVELRKFPRVAAYFGLGFLQGELVRDDEGEVIQSLTPDLLPIQRNEKTGEYDPIPEDQNISDEDGLVYTVAVVTTTTYRELVEKP